MVFYENGAITSLNSVAKLDWENCCRDGISNTFSIIPGALGKDDRIFVGDIDMIEKMGYKLEKVEINDVEKETYYATLFLSKGDEILEIDARPSDAIAVAMRAEAPIYVTANVLMNGSVSTDSAKDEEEAQEFKDFIQSIKPSDFEKLMKGRHEESDQ